MCPQHHFHLLRHSARHDGEQAPEEIPAPHELLPEQQLQQAAARQDLQLAGQGL